MLRLFRLALGLAYVQFALAGVHNWDIEWVTAAPDGFARPVIGINGQWPPPVLQATVGERMQITVNNKLGNETTSIHWHGITQRNSGVMDGPAAVTQCPIQPGATFLYDFIADDVGTYWYHSHVGTQYPDGLRGVFIVNDPNPPWAGKIAADYTITLSDWYHTQVPDLLKIYESPSNPSGAEPIPDSVLINDGQPAVYPVEAGKTYLFRVLNIGAFPSFYFNIDGHDFEIVEMDGVYTQPTTAKTFIVGAAMRYGILVTAKEGASGNFDIAALVDTSFFRDVSQFKSSPVVHATLQYDASQPAPFARTQAELIPAILPPIDDLTVEPLDNQPLLGPVTNQLIVDFTHGIVDGIPRHLVNGVTYLSQKVPSLYTGITLGPSYNTNAAVYGVNSNPMVVNAGDIVEIVINNWTPEPHPWHLHGHKFQVVARSDGGMLRGAPAQSAAGSSSSNRGRNQGGHRVQGGQGPQSGSGSSGYTGQNLPAIPMKRDTVGVRPGGYVVFRYKVDNPGVWLLHCHIEWHVASGLTATIIEAADQIGFGIPADHKAVCDAQGIPTAGNAAGNTRNPLDLTGANTVVPQEETGALYTGSGNTKTNPG